MFFHYILHLHTSEGSYGVAPQVPFLFRRGRGSSTPHHARYAWQIEEFALTNTHFARNLPFLTPTYPALTTPSLKHKPFQARIKASSICRVCPAFSNFVPTSPASLFICLNFKAFLLTLTQSLVSYES
jgi:hypothetical protein